MAPLPRRTTDPTDTQVITRRPMLPILTHTDKSGPATGEELGQDFLASQFGLAPRSIGIKPPWWGAK